MLFHPEDDDEDDDLLRRTGNLVASSDHLPSGVLRVSSRHCPCLLSARPSDQKPAQSRHVYLSSDEEMSSRKCRPTFRRQTDHGPVPPLCSGHHDSWPRPVHLPLPGTDRHSDVRGRHVVTRHFSICSCRSMGRPTLRFRASTWSLSPFTKHASAVMVRWSSPPA